MKKKIFIVLMVLGSLSVFSAAKNGTSRIFEGGESETKGHLDWDATDNLWRCVGSSLNCAFSNDEL